MSNGEAAAVLNINRKSVARIRRLQQHLSSTTPPMSRRGRKRKISVEQEKEIVAYTKRVKFTTPRDIKFHCDLVDVSLRTIDRILTRHGLFGRVARLIHPNLDAKKRLSFANGYLKLNWNTVIFSDEACVYEGPAGRVWVRRPRGEKNALAPEHCIKRAHHYQKLNIIGFITSQGVGECAIFNENMTGVLLKKLLDNTLLLTAQRAFKKNESWSLLHDNDKKFKSIVVTEWVHNHGVTVLEWPPYSPDLNPIEHVWADLKRRVEAVNPKGMLQLATAMMTCWLQTSPALCKKVVDSMPKRCQACIDNKGYKTGY
jgi:hypothetical protein